MHREGLPQTGQGLTAASPPHSPPHSSDTCEDRSQSILDLMDSAQRVSSEMAFVLAELRAVQTQRSLMAADIMLGNSS